MSVGRLEAKGAVTRTEGGRARLYAPAVPRERAALEGAVRPRPSARVFTIIPTLPR